MYVNQKSNDSRQTNKEDNIMELVRANKATAYWSGNGVAVANFYKTHDKVAAVKSDDQSVVDAGFKMPESTENMQVTAQDKLAAFKNFVLANASVFGVQYDPVDRRTDEFKFPNKYTEELFREYSRKIAISAIGTMVGKVQSNVIDRMIKGGHKQAGTVLDYGISEAPASVEISESYKNGNLKYANAVYDIVFQVGTDEKDAAQVQSTIKVELVSGQIKKPREFGDGLALTTVGIKGFLIDNGLLPKIEEKKPEEPSDGDETEEIPAGVAAGDEQAASADEPADAKA